MYKYLILYKYDEFRQQKFIYKLLLAFFMDIKKLYLSLFMLFAVLITGCGSVEGNIIADNVNEDEPIKITLAEMKAPVSAPITIAHLKGFYEDEGLDVDVKSFSIGRLGIDALINGGADFGNTGDFVTMNMIYRGGDLKVISTYFRDDESLSIVGKKSAGIENVNDLEGKRVGVAIGTPLEMYLYNLAKKYDIDYDKIEKINIAIPDMPSALNKGSIDAYSSVEPFITPIAKSLGNDSTVIFEKDVYEATGILLATNKVISDKPEAVEKFNNAINMGIEFLNDNPEEAYSILADYYGSDVETIRLSIERTNFILDFNKGKLIEDLKEEYELGVELNYLDKDSKMPDFSKNIFMD